MEGLGFGDKKLIPEIHLRNLLPEEIVAIWPVANRGDVSVSHDLHISETPSRFESLMRAIAEACR
jgi:hypothetical protein